MGVRSVTPRWVVITLCLFLSQVLCQDDDAFTVTVANYYNINSTDISFGFYNNDTDPTFYFTNILAPTIYWTTLPDVNGTNLVGRPLPSLSSVVLSTSESVTAYTAIMDTATDNVWVGTYDGIYQVNLESGEVDTISYPGIELVSSFVDVERREGYLVASDRIWKTELDRFNITYFTNINISITPSLRAVAYNKAKQMAFVGGSTGVEMVDTAAGESLGVNVFHAKYRAAVLIHDDVKERLYVCYDGDGSVTSQVVAYTIFGDNITVLHQFDMGNGELDFGDQCAGGAIDKETGQLFIVISQSNTGVVAAWDLSNYKLNGFTGFTADPRQKDASYLRSSPVGALKFPGQRSFYVLAANQLVQVQYSTNCLEDCSNHGTCSYGVCTCEENYVGDDCASLRCLNNCSYNGICSNGDCLCNANFTGADCSQRRCPGDCYGHGTCGGAPDYLCSCTGGWSAFDCSNPPPPAPPPTCPQITDYTSCVGYDYCGWCGDIISGRCMSGDLVGPVAGACTDWNFDEPPEIGVVVLASVILAVVGFMFILDAISAIRLDYKRGNDLRDEYLTGLQRKPSLTEAAALWWRDQRAAKAWTTLEHLQFLSVFANVALDFPTRYLYFSRFVYWTNLALPLPFLRDTTIHEDRLTGYAKETGLEATRRELLGMEQYANSLGVLPHDLYSNNIFWFGIALGGVILVYGALSLAFIKKTHWRVVFSCRLVYMIYRLLSVAYLGLMMTCGYTLVHPEHDYRILVPAILTLLIIGLGYPLSIFFLLKGKNKQLFDNEFKFKFGCLYVNYRPENSLFSLRIIARKFFTGILMGVMAVNLDNTPKYVAIIQVILLAIVQILYVVELVRTHPYYDHFHEYLEYLLVVVNVCTLGLSLIHYNEPNQTAYLITALIQVLALVGCMATYIVSWMQMHPNFSFAKLFKKDSKKKNNAAGELEETGDSSVGVNQE